MSARQVKTARQSRLYEGTPMQYTTEIKREPEHRQAINRVSECFHIPIPSLLYE